MKSVVKNMEYFLIFGLLSIIGTSNAEAQPGILGIFIYTYDPSFIGADLQVQQLSPQNYEKFLTQNQKEFLNNPKKLSNAFDFLGMLYGHCDIKLNCNRATCEKPKECVTEKPCKKCDECEKCVTNPSCETTTSSKSTTTPNEVTSTPSTTFSSSSTTPVTFTSGIIALSSSSSTTSPSTSEKTTSSTSTSEKTSSRFSTTSPTTTSSSTSKRTTIPTTSSSSITTTEKTTTLTTPSFITISRTSTPGPTYLPVARNTTTRPRWTGSWGTFDRGQYSTYVSRTTPDYLATWRSTRSKRKPTRTTVKYANVNDEENSFLVPPGNN